MEAEGGVFNVTGSPAVVVDDCHPVAGLQQLRTLHHIGAVGIHHQQQRPGLHLQKGLGAGNKHILVLRQGTQLLQHRLGGVTLQIDDHLSFLAPLPGNAAKARRGAHGIHVGKAVTHNIDLSGIGHQLAEGVGHDPGLDLGALLRGLAAAAIELEIHLSPDHRLVAAPAEGHLQGQIGVFIEFLHAVGTAADADGERGMDALAHLDVPDGIQNGEFLLHKVLIVLFLEQEQIAVPLGLQQQPLSGGGPVVQLLVDLGENGAAGGVGAGLHQILVVVQHQNRRHWAGCHILFLKDIRVSGIHPVGGSHQILLLSPALGPDQAAVDPEAAAVHQHPLRTLLLPLQQPLGRKRWHRILHLHLKEVLPDTGQLLEILVAPDHLAGIRPEDHDGQRRVDEGGFAGGIHTAGQVVDILQNALTAPFAAAGKVHVQSANGAKLYQAQQHVHPGSGNGENHHAQEVEFQIGLQQAGEFFVCHKKFSFAGKAYLIDILV